MQQYTLGATSSAEKDIEVPVSNMLTMSQKYALMAKWLHQEKHHQEVEGGDPLPLFSIGKSTSGILCQNLDPSVQDGHGFTGVSSMKGYEDWSISHKRNA